MSSVAIRNHLSRLMGERRLKIQDVASRSGLAYTTVFALYHDKARRVDLATVERYVARSRPASATSLSMCPRTRTR
jgi:AcrR family transcriptional regulator